MGTRIRGWAAAALGWLLLAVGVVLFPLPGPGLLLMLAGMVVLAREFEWAERRLDALRDKALESAHRSVETHARACWSILVCAVLAASGLLWLWAPAQPAWWVLPGWTWLPGGLWSGIGQLVSGLATLGLVVWSYHRRLTGSGTMRA
jgi:hypothetical protein